MRSINLRTGLAIPLFLLLLAGTATGRTIYVDANTPDNNDGSSWAHAYKYLQDAFADAISSGNVNEIRVAQGIYKPDQNSADPNGNGDREATFQLVNGLALMGGYAGFGEPDPNARNLELYETILSGDLDSNDSGIDLALYVADPNMAENSYHIVTSAGGADNTTVLDGFTITAGNADDPVLGGGGGMLNYGNPNVVFCAFIGNRAYEESQNVAGGGMCNLGSPNVTGCTFIGNVAEQYCGVEPGGGGGMYNQNNATVTNCTFIGNSSCAGGGIYEHYSDSTIIGCTFIENSAMRGAGIRTFGGGTLTVTNCTFSGNDDYGVQIGGGWSVVIDNCDFIGNRQGLYLSDGTMVINSTFIDNGTTTYGGGIVNYGSGTVTNCTLINNSATNFGGGIYSFGDGELVITNCILQGNTAPNGNEIALSSYYASTIAISYSDVQGGEMGVYDPCNSLVWGSGNIDTDPCFADSGQWTDPCNTPGDANDDVWIDGDYHLKSQSGRWDPCSESWVQDANTSPCIDAGDPNSSIGWEPFPNGGRINMGAYGGTEEASKSYFGTPVCTKPIAGDINGDCKVDFRDFAIMAFHWLGDNNP